MIIYIHQILDISFPRRADSGRGANITSRLALPTMWTTGTGYCRKSVWLWSCSTSSPCPLGSFPRKWEEREKGGVDTSKKNDYHLNTLWRKCLFIHHISSSLDAVVICCNSHDITDWYPVCFVYTGPQYWDYRKEAQTVRKAYRTILPSPCQ